MATLGVNAVSTVFLDRDGTINAGPLPGKYITSPEDLVLLPGAGPAVAQLNAAGLRTVLITNQRWLSQRSADWVAYRAVQGRLEQLLAVHGAWLDASYCCPHAIAACDCRKPGTGMLQRAAREHRFSLRESLVIGDSETDLEAGRPVGAATILLRSEPTGVPAGLADAVTTDLMAAVGLILEARAARGFLPKSPQVANVPGSARTFPCDSARRETDRRMRGRRFQEMTIEIFPITDRDIAAVADFLHVNYKGRIPWARSRLAGPWKVAAPNYGFMLRDGQRIVGAHLAFYSERLVAGRVERFCDLGTWYVLPEFRFHSIRLIKAVLAQDGYHFTALTPSDKVAPIHIRLGFRSLDTSAVLIPNLPWPTLPGRTAISADPAAIERTLAGTELKLYQDHAQALAVSHMVLLRGPDSCYVMYRETCAKSVPLAEIVYVSDRKLFHRAILPLTRHLLVHHRLLATRAELRIIGRRPALSFKAAPSRKLYRSASLEPDQIDDLYSELVCVPW